MSEDPHRRAWIRSLRNTLLRRRGAEPSLRTAIAELVEEAAEAPQEPGVAPELDRQERALIANVLRLRGTMVRDVMVPRADIIAVPINLTLPELLDRVRQDGHSRLPVYREQLDDIAGMVHIKDIYAWLDRSETFSLEKLLRQPLLAPPQTPVLDLLLQMRQARMHLALVIDEYGGVDGLVTIEDLVETIVGDIADEHDEVEGPMIVERGDGTADIDARLSIEAFEEHFGSILSQEERESLETVGGLVFMLAGHVPARGEVIAHPGGVEFLILEADARRIRRVRLVRALQTLQASGSGTSETVNNRKP